MAKTRQWYDLNLGRVIPDEIPDTVEFLNERVIEPFGDLLQSTTVFLEAGKLLILAEIDPVIAAITVVIDQLDAIIEQLRTTVTLHALFLPIVPTGQSVPQLKTIDPVVFDFNGFPIFRANPPVTDGSGGTWGFYNTYVSSLFDRGDLSRPNFPENSYIASLVLLFGAPSVGELLSTAFRLFRLLEKLVPFPMDGYLLPVPQNLAVRQITPHIQNDEIAVVGGDDSAYMVSVSWDLPRVVATIENLFKGVEVVIDSTSVYAKVGTDFTSTDSGEILADLEILRLEDPFFKIRADISGLDFSTTYYFAVGYNIIVTETQTDDDGNETTITTEIEHHSTGNSVRINLSELGIAPSGLPESMLPDWTSIRSPFAVFPPLEEALRTIQDLLQTLRDSILTTLLDEITELIETITEYIEFYLERIRALEDLLDVLVAVLRALELRIFAYGFYGKGGTSLLASEVNRALFDPAVQNRPPYLGGGDVVAGIVLVGGAPNLALIEPLIEILQLLFGDVFTRIEKDTVVAAPTAVPDDTVVTAAESINRIAGVAEKTAEELELLAGLGPPPEDIPTISLFEAANIGVDDGCLDDKTGA